MLVGALVERQADEDRGGRQQRQRRQGDLQPRDAAAMALGLGEAAFALSGSRRETFKTVATRKPEASRDRSAEVYLLGRGLKV